jgi:hypothetical protein
MAHYYAPKEKLFWKQGTIRCTGNNKKKNDLGWYVATDGGDALEDQCMVRALQKDQARSITTGSTTISYNGDGDQCGDVSIISSDSATISNVMIATSQVEMPCRDENEDGNVDFAICFTWKSDAEQ